ncbi:MAG: CHAD domain-containing protein [Rhodovibrionaceae bacterium]|nr:CHAD domain-containing protein [Rhodovibrionaceae bacterium]
MSYRFELQDETVQQGARRIAVEQIDKAIQEIDDSALDVHKTVHQIRKRCKKVRGLIRLVRGAFDGYREENAAFRDAARPLSYVRDSEALLETYDALVEAYEDQIDRPAFASVRRRLTLRQKEIADAHDLDRELADFRAEMTQAAKRARDWRIEAEGFAGLAGGLGKTYARARKRWLPPRANAPRRPSTSGGSGSNTIGITRASWPRRGPGHSRPIAMQPIR